MATYLPMYQEPPPPNRGGSWIFDPNAVTSQGLTGAVRFYQTSDAFPSAAMITPVTGTNLASTILTSGLLFSANTNRLSLVIQPINSGAYITYSATGAPVSPTNFHWYLPSGVAFIDQSWKGAVSIYASGAFSSFQTS